MSLDQSNLEITVNGLKVDGSAVTQPVSTAGVSNSTVTAVPCENGVAIILAANPARKAAIIFNDSPDTLFIKLGTAANDGDFSIKLAPYDDWEIPQPIYTGLVTGTWDGAPSGFARVTELS